VKGTTRLNLPRENFTRKRKKALTKLSSFRENFRSKEKKIRADLEKARKIWKKVGQRFKWWQSLP